MFLHIRLAIYEVMMLFLTVGFHSASCDVFYIVTTTKNPCPGEFTGVPCLTLQQYASNPSQSQNITFITEPGTYYLSSELRVSNGYSFTMSSENTTVACTSSSAGFSFDSVEKVHISGMTFQMCRNSAIKMASVTEAYITNTSFVGNVQQYGGAIYASSASAITIDQSTFSGNSATVQGGAVYCGSCLTITIDQSTFSNNSGGHGGGAIYAPSSTITIDQSTFSNYGAGAPGGGAIYAPSSTVTIEQSTFTDSRST